MELKNPDNLQYLQASAKRPGGCPKAIRLLVGQDAHGD